MKIQRFPKNLRMDYRLCFKLRIFSHQSADSFAKQILPSHRSVNEENEIKSPDGLKNKLAMFVIIHWGKKEIHYLVELKFECAGQEHQAAEE